MTRWKAFFIHLAISAIIASAVVAFMLLIWYPHPIFAAVGGQQILMILLAVDVTLGPFATLLVFNTKKSRKALTLDLSVIALLQASALIYGMSVVFQARPVYLALVEDSFKLVTANTLSEEDIARARNPDYLTLPLTGPVYVYSTQPANVEEIQEVVTAELSGKGLQHLPKFYKPYAEYGHTAGKASRPVADLRKINPERIAEIDKAVRASGRIEADVGYLPLRASYRNLVVMVGKSDGKVLAMLDLKPQ